MTVRFKDVIKLLVAIGLSGLIFWYLYRDIDMEKTKAYLERFDYRWILLSILLSFFSHLLRALRWGQLLDVSGKKTSIKVNYLAVMIGYLANTVIPRLGEVTRCGIVNKKQNVPLTFAIGTVVTERLIDLIILMILTAVVFLAEFSRLSSYFTDATQLINAFLVSYWWILIICAAFAIYAFWFLILSKKPSSNKIITKIRDLIQNGYQGVLSIRNIKRPFLFWVYTVGIWGLYFLMLYVISFGSEETKALGPMAGLAILVAGSFGMAMPSQSGLGTFHAFVSQLLLLYGIGLSEGEIFAFILHTSQLITVVILGLISLILINYVKPKNVETNPE